MCKLFRTTLLVEVEVAILKYGSPLHFFKSSVRRRKRSPHLREWSAEIRLLALRERGLLLQF
jgi:hypothetical protein